MPTSGTRIRGLSGPDKHSWFTPLKGVCHPVSSQHLHDGRQHHADACHLLHPQHDRGPPSAGVAAVGSKVFCMYDRIVWKKIVILLFNLHHLESLKENQSWWLSPSRWWVSGLSVQKLILLCVFVNYSETGTAIYIQSMQDKICAFFAGQNEAPIVRHSDTPSGHVRTHGLPNHTPSWCMIFSLTLSWRTVFLLTCCHNALSSTHTLSWQAVLFKVTCRPLQIVNQ